MANRPSIRDRVALHKTGEEAVEAFFLGTTPVVALASGEAFLPGVEPTRIALHDGAILAAAAHETALVTGGDDGRVVALTPGVAPRTVADTHGAWVDRVAVGPSGAIAWSVGKKAFFSAGRGEPKSLTLPSAAGGLAFFPKGTRLAIAHYGGASLWFPNISAASEVLDWKGSHLGITISPDGRFVVTTMQEPQLHGWRLDDGKHMRMSGYPKKVRAFVWTAGAKFLATSGAEQAILWPFTAKDGPMGKAPTMIAPSAEAGILVSTIAAHPKSEVVAVGYDDGLILLARIDDGAEILLRAPDGDRVTTIAWRADGQALIYGTEGGKVGLADL